MFLGGGGVVWYLSDGATGAKMRRRDEDAIGDSGNGCRDRGLVCLVRFAGAGACGDEAVRLRRRVVSGAGSGGDEEGSCLTRMEL